MERGKIKLHICTKNTHFQEFTNHTKIDMLLSFWLHAGTHQTFKLSMTMDKGVWSYLVPCWELEKTRLKTGL